LDALPMRLVLTALIFVIGLFDLLMAGSFLLTPLTVAQGLGVVPVDLSGISTIRGDFTSFFGVAGFAMLWGAWRRNADLLLVPLLLFAVTLAGRAIDLVVTGPYPGWAMPMSVEAVEVVLLLAGWHYLPHHKIAELAD
jgi:hypothetical protein